MVGSEFTGDDEIEILGVFRLGLKQPVNGANCGIWETRDVSFMNDASCS